VRNILYFTADWCHPCKKVKPVVEELNRESSGVKFQVIDADSETELVKKFEVRSVPTFIVLDGGVEITRATGAQTREQLLALMSDE
jgi:thioredoxin-like negative regulator of GroEL